MKEPNWKLIAELVGLAAIVSSLIFVGIQIQQDHELGEIELLSSSDGTATDLYGLISDNSEIWIKGLNGEPLTDSERISFAAVAEAVYRRNSNLYRVSLRLDSMSEDYRARVYAFFLYQHPGLRQLHNERAEGNREIDRAFGSPIGSSFSTVIDKYLAELDADSPPVTVRTYIPRS